jgi:hypothetical protein
MNECVSRDKAIPSLDDVDGNSETADQDALEQSRLSIILENQIRLEKSVENMIREETDESYPNLKTEAQPPPVSQEFQTARLLLSHLGFIALQVCFLLNFYSSFRHPLFRPSIIQCYKNINI